MSRNRARQTTGALAIVLVLSSCGVTATVTTASQSSGPPATTQKSEISGAAVQTRTAQLPFPLPEPFDQSKYPPVNKFQDPPGTYGTVAPLAAVPIDNSSAPRPITKSMDEAIQQSVSGLTPGAIAESEEDGGGLYTVVKASDPSPAAELEPQWEMDLLRGAVAERTATTPDLFDALPSWGFNFVLPSGELSMGSVGMAASPHVAAGQQFAGSALSDDDIRADVTSILGEYGLTTVTINVLHPLGPVPQVTARLASDGALEGRLPELVQELFNNRGAGPFYEGFYLAIQLPDGSMVAQNSIAYRTGAGSSSIVPGYEGELGSTARMGK